MPSGGRTEIEHPNNLEFWQRIMLINNCDDYNHYMNNYYPIPDCEPNKGKEKGVWIVQHDEKKEIQEEKSLEAMDIDATTLNDVKCKPTHFVGDLRNIVQKTVNGSLSRYASVNENSDSELETDGRKVSEIQNGLDMDIKEDMAEGNVDDIDEEEYGMKMDLW